MNAIESVHIRGFRSLGDFRVDDLPNVTVMIGPNGAGKSNFVRFFEMMGWMLMAPRRLARFVRWQGGADDQLFGGHARTVAPADPLDAHRPLPQDTDLEALFAETDTRVVARDFTVRFENRFWQVTARDAETAGVAPGSPVVVERHLSGELRFRHRGSYLTPKALGPVRSATPKPARARDSQAQAQAAEAGKGSPWRKHFRPSVAQAVAKREHRAAHSYGTGPEQCRASS